MRAAVLLRGHRRTWDLCRDAMVRTMDQLCLTTHYYICHWRSGSNPWPMRSHAGMHIKHAELTGPEHWDLEDSMNCFTAPSWQAQRCYRAMMATGISYDLVMDTRSDIWLEPAAAQPQLPQPGEIHSTRLLDPWHDSSMPGMEDHLFVADPQTMGLWCQRHLHPRYDIRYNHCILCNHCSEQGLVPRQIDWLVSRFVRPNAAAHQPLDAQQVHLAHMDWNRMTRELRLAHCAAAGIDHTEYDAPYHLGTA